MFRPTSTVKEINRLQITILAYTKEFVLQGEKGETKLNSNGKEHDNYNLNKIYLSDFFINHF